MFFIHFNLSIRLCKCKNASLLTNCFGYTKIVRKKCIVHMRIPTYLWKMFKVFRRFNKSRYSRVQLLWRSLFVCVLCVICIVCTVWMRFVFCWAFLLMTSQGLIGTSTMYHHRHRLTDDLKDDLNMQQKISIYETIVEPHFTYWESILFMADAGELDRM